MTPSSDNADYQALTDKAVDAYTKAEADASFVHTSPTNILEILTIKEGYALHPSNGSDYAISGHVLWEDYVPVKKGYVIKALLCENNAYYTMMVYDSNKRMVRKIDKTLGQDYIVEDDSAAFVRFGAASNNGIDNFYAIVSDKPIDLPLSLNRLDTSHGFDYYAEWTPSPKFFLSTPFIPVVPGDSIYLFIEDNITPMGDAQGPKPLTFYDSAKAVVSTATFVRGRLNLIEVPENASYVKFTHNSDNAKAQSLNIAIGFVKSLKSRMYIGREIAGCKDILDEISGILNYEDKVVIDSWTADEARIAVSVTSDRSASATGIWRYDDARYVNIYLFSQYGSDLYRSLPMKSQSCLPPNCEDLQFVSVVDLTLLTDNVVYVGNTTRGRTWLRQGAKTSISVYHTGTLPQIEVTGTLAGAEIKVEPVSLMLVNTAQFEKYGSQSESGRKSLLLRCKSENFSKFALSLPVLNTYRKLVQFGDSIMAGARFIPSCDILGLRYDMEVVNAAVDGSSPINYNTSKWNLSDENLANITPDTGVVLIFGGVNAPADVASGHKGEIDSRDRSTMYGCINYAIDYAKSVNPCVIIGLMTSTFTYQNGTFGYREDWTGVYRDIARARKGEVVLIDLADDTLLVNESNIMYMLHDGLHPSQEYAVRIAAKCASVLDNYLI